ncbi:phytase [Nocardioides marmotae]|uniref:phytase n=1 Tax=Nocardioides marmotae TaxID=2663857 RepID=UPI0014958914|nr:phytase [Nocardioides marmotae]QKE02609.1 phytase [Nocardioides marmotae]
MHARTARILVGVLAPTTLLGAALAGAGPASPAASAPVAAAPDPVALVASVRETVSVASAGDALDDPAVWVHPSDPARSLVLGNDKLGGLETYDLDGNLVQRLTDDTAFWGNVDVRQRVAVDGVVRDVVAVAHDGLRLYDVDPATRLLRDTGEDRAITGSGEGVCLWVDAAAQEVHVVLITIAGRLQQYRLGDADADGLLEGTLVRDLEVGSEAEGCVADDDTGALYVSEEDTGLWRYAADPATGDDRTLVDGVATAGGHLVPDVEGVTLVDLPDGTGYVVASAQDLEDPDASYFAVYDRLDNTYVRSFRVDAGADSDDCDRTDGITAVATPLGPDFPRGIFVCQDHDNQAPGGAGNQDFKYVPLETAVALPDPPPPASPVRPVAAVVTGANATAWTTRVPGAVRPGDALLLFFSRSTGPGRFTGPGRGWTRVRALRDGTLRTTLWRRVVTAADAGSTVAVSFSTGVRQGALTLAAYRGVRRSGPVAGSAAAPEPGTSATHRTPMVTAPAGGAWRVSYWATKSAAATAWAAPAGEVVRATSAGAGGGRVATLLTDPGRAVPAGRTGGLVAGTDAATDKATSWTVLLAPRPS